MHETCELGTPLSTSRCLLLQSMASASSPIIYLNIVPGYYLCVELWKKHMHRWLEIKEIHLGVECKHPPPVNISPPHKIWHHLQMETSLPLSPVLFVEGFLTVSGPQSDWFQSTVGYAGFMEIISVLRKRVHVGHRRLCRTMQSIPPLPPESLKRRRRVLVDNPRSIQRMLGYLSNVCTDT